MGSHFGVGEFTTQFRTYLSGDWDVHWGYDLGFDPWPKGLVSLTPLSSLPEFDLKLFGLGPWQKKQKCVDFLGQSEAQEQEELRLFFFVPGSLGNWEIGRFVSGMCACH